MGEQHINKQAVKPQQENISTGWQPFFWEKWERCKIYLINVCFQKDHEFVLYLIVDLVFGLFYFKILFYFMFAL